MELSELLKLLFPLMSGETKEKNYDFTAQLLGNSYDVDTAVPSIDVFGFSDDKLRRLFNGNRKLSKRDAKAIISTFDERRCSKFIDQNMNGDTLNILSHSLEERVGDFGDSAVSKYVELLYDSILKLNVGHPTEVLNIDDVNIVNVQYKNGKFLFKNKVVDILKSIEVPDDIVEEEKFYIVALLKAYSDADSVKCYNLKSLPDKYKRDIRHQRHNYYDAEVVRRGIRDNFRTDEYHRLIVNLKDDMYEGIVDTCEEDYNNGYLRLKSVLNRSLEVSINKSELARIPGLIGNSERKGLCHMLVTDGKITWVVNDE